MSDCLSYRRVVLLLMSKVSDCNDLVEVVVEVVE